MVDLVVPVSVPAGTGANLLDLCRRVADTVGFRMPTVTSAEASHGDPSRVVLADELRDDEVGFDFMASGWLYVVDGDQQQTQRRTLDQPGVGYQGPRGALVVSRPFTAPLEEGVTIEATSPLPMRLHAGVQGYREAINQGLGLIWVKARLGVVGNGTYSYDLATYAQYLDRPDVQIQSIDDTQWLGASYPADISAARYRVVTNGVTRTLVTEAAYASGETFYVNALVKADRLRFDGSAWGYVVSGTPGLLEDDYQTAAPADWAYTFACWKAYQNLEKIVRMRNGISPEERDRALSDILEKRLSWARAAAKIKVERFPRAPAEPMRELATTVCPPVWM